MNIVSIVGARPQFIKAAPVSRALEERGHAEYLVHTGQHYDHGMSRVFFEELGLRQADVNLGVGSASHGIQTGKILAGIEELLLQRQPDWVLVYGDTNSTLAGALAAAKLQIPLAHVEAGLRSFKRAMPEEINRVVADHCAQALFCPTQTAVDNLAHEGIHEGVFLVGDVMFDALVHFLPRTDEATTLAAKGVCAGQYVLATIHRAGNTDDPQMLGACLSCLAASQWPVLLPAHPRTVAAVEHFGLEFPANVLVIGPVSYLEMLALEKNARAIMTDSGGIQKEAYILGVPCITLRDETEWVETLSAGWNVLVGTSRDEAVRALEQPPPPLAPPSVFGDGTAADQMVEALQRLTP